MGGRVLVRLAAREKRDAGHRSRHAGLERLDGLLGDFGNGCPPGALLAGDHHVGLEYHAFERNLLIVKLLEYGLERPFRDNVAAIDVVAAVHQHLGLHDRHDAFLLAERCITREHVGVRHDAGVARDVGADVDHRAPLGELGAEAAIFGEPFAQAIEPLGDDLVRAERQRLCALVDLDARQ